MKTIEQSIELIQKLHAGQFDWSGIPYWMHPVAVMDTLPAGSWIERKQIALYHDIIEDCLDNIAEILDVPAAEMNNSLAAQYLLDLGHSVHIVRGVGLLTRQKNDLSYITEIRNIVDSNHIDAMWVKLCDNTQNTHPDRIDKMSPENKAKSIEMGKRYERSKAILKAGILSRLSNTFVYKFGDPAVRNVHPISMRYGTSDIFKSDQWLLLATDNDTGEQVELSFDHIQEVYKE